MLDTQKSSMANPLQEWLGGKAKSVTFSLTEECNLRCKYCYMISKSNHNKMSLETAKKAVDFILSSNFEEIGVVWDFIGGEPLLEIDLIDELTDYIIVEQFKHKPSWVGAHRFMITTNGVLYHTETVQNYLNKHRHNVEIAITLDGNKTKHDLQRVFPDGTGSYDVVVKNVKLWLKQYPNASTKATFSHDDLPHLKDSIISIWEQGIKRVAANVVYEDVWLEGDDLILEEQLNELADHVIEHALWKDHFVSFFNPNHGFKYSEDDLNRNHCGSGKMIAIDTKGKLFPCIRFLDFTLGDKKFEPSGNIYDGLNMDRIRPFLNLTARNQSPKECLECEVATGCGWCTGNNFDSTKNPTIYNRITANCLMHKATVRSVERFWNLYAEKTGNISPREKLKAAKKVVRKSNRYLYIIQDSKFKPHCNYENNGNDGTNMSCELLKEAYDFAEREDYTPVLLTEAGISMNRGSGDAETHHIEIFQINGPSSLIDNCIIKITKKDLMTFANLIISSTNWRRINMFIEDLDCWDESDFLKYSTGLDLLSQFILSKYKNNEKFEINKLTDLINYGPEECGAGISSICIAPNGKIYSCPAFFLKFPTETIGDIKNGLYIDRVKACNKKESPVCKGCDINNCITCIYSNRSSTGELHIPSFNYCRLSAIENEMSKFLRAEFESLKPLKGVI